MKKLPMIKAILVMLIVCATQMASADEAPYFPLAADSYRCKEFISDFKAPKSDSFAKMRVVFIVSVAMGRMLANSEKKGLPNKPAFEISLATLIGSCQERPDELACSAFVQSIKKACAELGEAQKVNCR